MAEVQTDLGRQMHRDDPRIVEVTHLDRVAAQLDDLDYEARDPPRT